MGTGVDERDAERAVDPPAYIDRTLRRMWLFWAVMLALQGAGLLIAAWAGGPTGRLREASGLYRWLAPGVLLVAVPYAFFLRGQTYKAHWRGCRIGADGYASAFWSKTMILAAVNLAVMVSFFEVGPGWPAGVAAAATFGVQLAGYPIRTPMLPCAPRTGGEA